MTGTNDFLATIVEAKRHEVAERKRKRPLETLLETVERTQHRTRDLRAALAAPGLSAIAEIKRRSPSRGPLRPDADVPAIARSYGQNGAAAVSVLTDREFFGGSDNDLAAVCDATSLPVLRKDFTVDAYQIHEAQAIGADAVLLIASILQDGRLSEWVALCRELALTALVEVHDESEMTHALDAGAVVVGVNSRDLRTFRTDLAVTAQLRSSIPEGIVAVAESGIHTAGDVETVRRAGYDAFLVGESLMTAPDPGKALSLLMGADS